MALGVLMWEPWAARQAQVQRSAPAATTPLVTKVPAVSRSEPVPPKPRIVTQPKPVATTVGRITTPRGPAAPIFASRIERIGPSLAADLVSWRPGCPVPLEQLRLVHVRHWDFEGRIRAGVLIVRDTVAEGVVSVMRRLFELRYPIRRMQLVDDFGADDFRSIEADNTSAFNCRAATGSTAWSQHAFGQAIDLNPIENPYVSTQGTSAHPASSAYLERSRDLPGMVHAGDEITAAFASIGWGWGGTWGGPWDYQHFSLSGH